MKILKGEFCFDTELIQKYEGIREHLKMEALRILGNQIWRNKCLPIKERENPKNKTETLHEVVGYLYTETEIENINNLLNLILAETYPDDIRSNIKTIQNILNGTDKKKQS